jgi:hypothetical protein
MNIPYIPGDTPPPKLPLGRFLPPIPQGMVTAWCSEHLHPGEWVLEPFGFNPMVPVEIAMAGHPVLVTVNNPIHAFLLQVLASAPQEDELVAALQDLATAPKGDERMEPYIRSLYAVICADCKRKIEADAFLWNKGEEHPYGVVVDCPFCGARGEQELAEEALESLTPLPPKQLHQARALNTIADRYDPLRPQVENALNAYPTRPLIVLQTMINRLEGLEQSSRRRELLTALILSAADAGNTLWSYPSPRNRPRQLVVPTVYQEKNLWKVMEEAIRTWQVLPAPIPLTDWQGEVSKTPGIYRFQGRIKALDMRPESERISAVIMAVPRPNQAFWTLSALWTGWIWGKEAVSPIRQVLSRQRYDWNWHTNALMGVFEELNSSTFASPKIWGLVAENEPMLLLATLLAANAAGFSLLSFAQSLDDQLAQCAWESYPKPKTPLQPDLKNQSARLAISHFIKQKGEPASYEQVYAAAVAGMAHANQLVVEIFLQNKNQFASETQKWLEMPFQDQDFLKRVAGGSASLETGQWWLVHDQNVNKALIDRLEAHIFEHLVETRTTTALEVKKKAFRAFPGIFTPTDSELLNCLESYADLIDEVEHRWRLRETELPVKRKQDVEAVEASIRHIAERLDYLVSGHQPLIWYDAQDSIPKYHFYIISSAIIPKQVQDQALHAQKNILILPGSRANLLAYKEQRDPVFSTMLDRHFQVVKFRLIRDLEANPLLTRELFKEQIRVDPPEYRTSQLALF